MTLNGVATLISVISPNSVASGMHCAKVVEDIVVKMFTFAISSPGEFLAIVRQMHENYLVLKERNSNLSLWIWKKVLIGFREK